MIRASSSCDRPLSRSLYFHPRKRSQARSILTVSKRITADRQQEQLGLLTALVDALPEGLMVLSADRTLIYLSQKARVLCQKLADTQRYWAGPPFIITDLCDRLIEASADGSAAAIVEYQTSEHQLIRLTARWFDRPPSDSTATPQGQAAAPHILVILEDREESLQQDVWVEQQKFCLTKREAEIWSLLKREYSYQAIASTLQISFNTVKTHIRNIQSKRHLH